MKIVFFMGCIVFSVLSIEETHLASYMFAPMQPIKKNGKYYYSEDDTYRHIDLKREVASVAKKLLSPGQWAQKVASWWYPHQKSNPIDFLQPTQTVPEAVSIEPRIIWIGHSTFLIQMHGFNILTDPVFGDAKFCPFSTTKRAMPVGVRLEDLPPIDAVVISHNHNDHMDRESLMALYKKHQPTFFVPEGNKKFLEEMGCSRIIESNWWEAHTITKNGNSVTCTCLPAYHWSLRSSLGSYRQALWCSWMISSSDTHMYFAGDTAYGKHFKEISYCFPSIDVALMPIGPTEEGENIHKYSHMDACEAVDAFIDLGAYCFIPMHYGTFFLSKSTLEYPVQKLHAYWQKRQSLLFDKNLLFARCGEQYCLGKT